MKEAATMTLTQDITTYWNQCLAVNSSWREFTHTLAILNSFDSLHIEDCETVADLLLDNELFTHEHYNDLLLSCFEFATELEVAPEDIDSNDLYKLTETGFTLDEVIILAADNGVSAKVIDELSAEFAD